MFSANRRRLISLAILAAAVCSGRLHAGQAPADPTTPVRMRVALLASHILAFAGQRVRLLDGTVTRIAGERVFMLTGSAAAIRDTAPREVAVLVPGGSVILREGAPIVVTGIARTLLGASVAG
jgi:hypothetical protein